MNQNTFDERIIDPTILLPRGVAQILSEFDKHKEVLQMMNLFKSRRKEGNTIPTYLQFSAELQMVFADQVCATEGEGHRRAFSALLAEEGTQEIKQTQTLLAI